MLRQSGDSPANARHDTCPRASGNSEDQWQDAALSYQAGVPLGYQTFFPASAYSAIASVIPYDQHSTIRTGTTVIDPVNFRIPGTTPDTHVCLVGSPYLADWGVAISHDYTSDNVSTNFPIHQYPTRIPDRHTPFWGSYLQDRPLQKHTVLLQENIWPAIMAPSSSDLDTVNRTFGTEEVSPHDESTDVPTSSDYKKRSRDSPMEEEPEDSIHVERLRESQMSPQSTPRRRSSTSLNGRISKTAIRGLDDEHDKSGSNTKSYRISVESLTTRQQEFVRHWYETLAQSESFPILSNETLSALATLTQAHPQLLIGYINKEYPSISSNTPFSHIPLRTGLDKQSPQPRDTTIPISTALSAANAHLLPATLALVEKHIATCRRPRPQTDGRRSVNTGAYRCTFGCNYATCRRFDWRRHEETHEPQEIWLCTLCAHTPTDHAFIVSRKDKFLKHAKEVHGRGWKPEEVLDLSRVDFRPRSELACGECGSLSRTWEERCRHVVGHFEAAGTTLDRRKRVKVSESTSSSCEEGGDEDS